MFQDVFKSSCMLATVPGFTPIFLDSVKLEKSVQLYSFRRVVYLGSWNIKIARNIRFVVA